MDIKKSVRNILSGILEISTEQANDIGVDDALDEKGLTSLRFIDMIVALEDTFNIEVKDSDLIPRKFNTISDITQMISKYTESEDHPVSYKKVVFCDCDSVLWTGAPIACVLGLRYTKRRSFILSFSGGFFMWLLLGTTITASFFDSLNPSAIAQQMLLQAMVKQKRHTLYFILGIGTANLAMGLAIYYGVAAWASVLLKKFTDAYPQYVYGAAVAAAAPPSCWTNKYDVFKYVNRKTI